MPAVPPAGPARWTIRIVPPAGPEADAHWSMVRLGLVADLLAGVAEHRGVRASCELEGGPPPEWLATALLDERAFVVPRRRLDGAGWFRPAPSRSAARRRLEARCDVMATPLDEAGWHTTGSLTSASERADRWLAALGAWAGAPPAPADDAVVVEVDGLLGDTATWPAALDRLDRLVQARSPATGACYECLAWVDRVLGLGLVAAAGEQAEGRPPRRSHG